MRLYRPGAGSLAFPIGIIVVNGFLLVGYHLLGIGLGSYFVPAWSCAAAIVFGGILPIALTFALKIDTREYFLPRLVFYLCTLAAISIPAEFVNVPRGGTVILTAVSAALTLLYFYKFRPARFKEWIVIFLSTPQIYMMINRLLLLQVNIGYDF